MQTAKELKGGVKDIKGVQLGDNESLIEHASSLTRERSRIEAVALHEDVTARQAVMASLEPKEQARFREYLKPHTMEAMPAPKPDRWPPFFTTVDYQVLHAPYATLTGVPTPMVATNCLNSVSPGQTVSIKRWSREGNAAQGALSIEAAVGEFFNVSCDALEPWFIGEANIADAALIQSRVSGITLNTAAYVFIGADFVLEGPASPWATYMFPGEPSSGLGLVGFLGVANLAAYYNDGSGTAVRSASERFLLGSASAFFPGEVDRKPNFTLSQLLVFPANAPIYYYLVLSAELTAFRTIPVQDGGYPGYAQANLTLPGSGAALGPSTPLKVSEIRASICTF